MDSAIQRLNNPGQMYKLHLFTLGVLPYIDKKRLPESVLTLLVCLEDEMMLRNDTNLEAVEWPEQVIMKRLSARTESNLKETA